MRESAATTGVLERLRAAARLVTERAQLVELDDTALHRLADRLHREPPQSAYPPEYFRGDDATTAAFVVTLETVNFGSGWFPHLAKRPGRSGHFTIAMGLTDRAARGELWSAAELAELTPNDCAATFGQPVEGPAFELMQLFAAALRQLGELLLERYDGRPTALVEAADHSAERLVALLDAMPMFHDVGHLDGLDVPFFKRAQICSATLWLAFSGRGLGRFDDLDRLTMFADNLVPHVLWCEGALRLDPDLERRIASEELLPAGGREEIELRAAAVEAVERVVAAAARRGSHLSARAVDEWLWSRGQRSTFKARPRPRIRTTAF
jgi:hypothetical protein